MFKTIGYGDIPIKRAETKVFLCFYIFLSTALLAYMLNNLYAMLQNRKILHQRKQLLKLQKRLHFLADMNDGRGLTKYEFVLAILEHIGTIDHEKDVAPWLKVSPYLYSGL
jgi:hypothetical protein